MSEPEKFIDRWSRRKREATDEPVPVETKDATAVAPAAPAEAEAPAAEVPFDPASLSPIESIVAESDVRAFLRPGVPPELTRAALRRAWSADPAIRDFVGLVENGWDFNDPNGILGFGPIQASEVARLLAQAIGSSPAEKAGPRQVLAQSDFVQAPPPAVESEPVAQSPQDQPAAAQDVAAPEKDSVHRSEDDVAMQNNSDDLDEVSPSRQRGHGGALPKL